MITDRIDVFLSRKSQDAHLAKEVYDFLTSKGLQVFDSDHSLLEMGNSDYSRAIDDALVKTNHLIVIGSSVENITSSWVEAEWRFFLNRKRANKTKGNILTVVTKTVAIDDLPPSLQNYEVIPFEKKNEKILPYVMVRHVKKPIVEEKINEPVTAKTIDYASLSDIELEQKANEGIAEAQNLLGRRNELKGDYSIAFKWYLKAAEQGNSNALNNIGFLYHFGNGVEQDYKLALQLYLKAAGKENAIAQNNIGYLYQYGKGVLQDYKQAMQWYLKAAEQGNANAQFTIGSFYDYGQGVNQDYFQAMQWYLKAAEQGNAFAQYNIGALYLHGQGVKQDYSQAMQWFLKAVEQGTAIAQFNIGSLYNHGQGVKQDYKQALQWYLKAAEQGNASAQNNIGALYFNGQGVKQDKEKAKEWFLKAAKQGNEPAKEWLKKEYNITDY